MEQSVVVIGNFDGVHPGHREVLKAAQRLEPGLPLVVVTFWPHPLSVIRKDTGPMLLTGLDERVALLKHAGANRVEVIDFTEDVMRWSPERFVRDVVVPLQPARVVVGENFRFGFKAAGTVDTLRELSEGRFEVTALPLVKYENEETCSTRIREALLAGDVAHAAEHLGRPFRFTGIVRHGDQRGRQLGFPTANLNVPDHLACPADGVYAGWVTRLDKLDSHGFRLPKGVRPDVWPAAISVGTNPTFDGHVRRVESYVLDRDDLELYGALLAVDFVAHIRGQVRFDGIDSLIVTMRHDVERTRELLAVRPDR